MMRNGTITGITVQTNASKSWTLQIIKNDASGSIVITSLAISGKGGYNNSLNIDVTEGDNLQAYFNKTVPGNPGNPDSPQVLIEIAWRK
jgi:hypothetical protein